MNNNNKIKLERREREGEKLQCSYRNSCLRKIANDCFVMADTPGDQRIPRSSIARESKFKVQE